MSSGWRSGLKRLSFLFMFLWVFGATNTLPQDTSWQVVPDELVLKAQIKGNARVIVQIREPFQPEGKLKNLVAVAFQRKGIAIAQEQLLNQLRNTSHRIFHRFETIPFLAMEAGIHALAILERSGIAVKVEEDRLSSPMLSRSVPLVVGSSAWGRGFDGNGHTIAILDTGVDKNHSFLPGKVVAEACFSGNGNCPNGKTTQIGSGAGVPCTYATDRCRHGTHTAGIAAGNGASFSGVAKGANLIAIQVFSRFSGVECLNAGEDPCTMAYSSDLIAALEHVFKLRSSFQIASVNMSLAGNTFTTQTGCDAANSATKAAIDNLRSVGIATVASSGNGGFSNAIGYPACISSAVSVGSTTKNDAMSSFSNSASFLSLLAPGESINSSIPGGGFGFKTGTSMSASHVAGAWAILKQRAPAATVEDVLNALRTTGLPIVNNENQITVPRIRVDHAMNLLFQPVIGVFRPGTGIWYLDEGNGIWNGCGVDECFGPFGVFRDLPVSGDWLGTGVTNVGVFRPGSGMWYIDLDGNGIWSGCGIDGCWGEFGRQGDLPVTGDWNGNGRASIGVFRPSTGMWYLDNGDGIWSGCGIDQCLGPFGSSGDLPVAADWTNTGTAKIGVFRPGTGMWYLDNGDGIWSGCGIDLCKGPFGARIDLPVAGDWNGTGTAKIGVFRPGTGMWYLDTGNGTWNGCGIDICSGPFGLPGDRPLISLVER
jgi:subtilisin